MRLKIESRVGDAIILLFIIGVLFWNTWLTLRLDSRIVGKTPEGWHREDMAEWVDECHGKGICDPYLMQRYLETLQQTDDHETSPSSTGE